MEHLDNLPSRPGLKPAANSVQRFLGILFVGIMALVLVACTNNDVGDLEAYVKSVKSKTKGHIEPLPEFKPFESADYTTQTGTDPFTPWKLQETASAVVAGSGSAGIRPDPNRRREPLERYPLDTLKMVGTLDVKGKTWALIMAPDGIVHRVRVGNYMGKNFGKIIKVNDDRVALREIVPDGLGNWRVREAAVALSE
jgi:type IV pilus assembly protein PilP